MVYNRIIARKFEFIPDKNVKKNNHFVMLPFRIKVFQSNLKQNNDFKSVKFKSTWCKVQVVKSCQYNEKRNKSL